MITATIYRNQNARIYGFRILNHSESIVCAAVSALAINAANSIEKFTNAYIKCEFEDEGGFLFLELPEVKSGGFNEAADLLLRSLELGILSISEQYKGQIKVLRK